MEKFHKDLLITHRTELVKNIDVTNGLFSKLVQRGVLSPRMVRNNKTNEDINTQTEELLDLLPRRGPEAFHLFCESLIDNDQRHIVDYILNAKAPREKTAKSGTGCFAYSSHVSSSAADASSLTATASLSVIYQNHQQKRAEKVHKDLLITHRTDLVENIDVTNGLFSELVQRDVLSPRMVRNIKNNKDIDTQIEELLDILPRRGPEAFHLFLESLIANDQRHIVDCILNVNIAKAPTEKSA